MKMQEWASSSGGDPGGGAGAVMLVSGRRRTVGLCVSRDEMSEYRLSPL
jgi:hypothetical protein